MVSPSRLPWPQFPEPVAISELMERSDEFRKFYSSERGKIKSQVLWALDEKIPDGINARSTRVAPAVFVLRFRRIPVPVTEACLTAHEMTHVLLDEEGFPMTGSSNNEELSSALNSMLHDPLVDARIREYGFNIGAEYLAEVRESIKAIRAAPHGATIPRIHSTRYIFNYVGYLLSWELVKESDNAPNEFALAFQEKYPVFARRGNRLLKQIQQSGYDTPEKQKRLFRDIIRRFKISNIVQLA